MPSSYLKACQIRPYAYKHKNVISNAFYSYICNLNSSNVNVNTFKSVIITKWINLWYYSYQRLIHFDIILLTFFCRNIDSFLL